MERHNGLVPTPHPSIGVALRVPPVTNAPKLGACHHHDSPRGTDNKWGIHKLAKIACEEPMSKAMTSLARGFGRPSSWNAAPSGQTPSPTSQISLSSSLWGPMRIQKSLVWNGRQQPMECRRLDRHDALHATRQVHLLVRKCRRLQG